MRECGNANPGRKKKRLAAHTRACLLWGLAIFAAADVAVLAITQSWCSYLRDPEFGYKLKSLRRSRAAEPDRPLLILLGTSRTGQGVRPGVMPALRTSDGREPLVFNFSQVGSGPLAELMTLRRLLDAGIRPDWLAIEILPALLSRPVDIFEASTGVCRLNWNDVRLLRRYAVDPTTLERHWIKDQFWPYYAHRFSFLNHYASDWVPWRLRLDHWKQLDRWGWSDIGSDNQPLVIVPYALNVTRSTYFDDLQHMQIAAEPDRALRDLLALCRKEKIPTLLYLMPEGSIFRYWYDPAVSARINEYLTRLSRDCNVPIVDMRMWMEDKYFGDSHHLYRLGASLLSRRFASEVLARLVQGKLVSLPALIAPLSEPYPQPQEQPPAMTRQTRPASPVLSIDRSRVRPSRARSEAE